MNLFDIINQHLPAIVLALLVLVFILLILIIVFSVKLSGTRKRYNRMMQGVEEENLEGMLLAHIATVEDLKNRTKELREEAERQDAILKRAITRVGVIRFRAFPDMGGDLSYAVALIDSHDNGVVLSSIFAREDSRSYVKPIESGKSNYALTEEEAEALKIALHS
ncbi:DUF4446 family protein [Selenomonas sp. TAMA-11512]|uniref:DUF4446 family protein n=1 Tax=Selenomonas sp. TAMA-11512 TaxID=3095337 RepID=UPI0030CEA466